MGREIIVEARVVDNKTKSPRTIWEDYVCGRDDATGYIAMVINNKVQNGSEPEPDDNASEEEWSEYYSVSFDFYSASDMIALNDVIDNLQGYADTDNNEIQKAKDELDDLRAARRNATNIEDFCSFGEEIERVRNWIETEDYSRAEMLVSMIKVALKKLEDDDSESKFVRIVLSE